MRRRDFLKASGITAVLGLVDVASAKSKPTRKPNVIFIITDDQELDSFGFIKGKALTPNIDKMAANGAYFSRGYATTSVCTPSRYTCLTGRYASRCDSSKFLKSGITDEGQTWVHWNADLGKHETNVAKVLRDAGYATGIVGKLHGFSMEGHAKSLNGKSDPRDPAVIKQLQDDQKLFAAELKNHGFDYAARFNRGNLGSTKSLPKELCQHSPEWTTEGVLSFIDENKDRPFYLYYATTLMHGPSPIQSLKADPRITEAGYLDEPPKVMPSRNSVLQRAKKAGVPENLAPVTWLDDCIGAIFDKLQALDLTDDTLVILFNDHGAENGKGSLYEGGVRTPIIIRWPGKIKAGQRDQLITNADFVPTILNACGVDKPAEMTVDGVDLMPVLSGKSDKTHESIFCEIGYTRAVITDRYKYLAFRVPTSRVESKEVRMKNIQEILKKNPKKSPLKNNPEGRITHIHRSPGGDGTELGNGLVRYKKNYFDADQLYDLKNDPDEQINLADDPKYANVLKKMKSELKNHLAGAKGTFAEFKK